MSAPSERISIRGEVQTREHLPEYAEIDDAYIIRDRGEVVVRVATGPEGRARGWADVPHPEVWITQKRAAWYDALRDDEYDPIADDIVSDFWPYDGPYSQWTTAAAATAIGRLTRYLNNATQKDGGLPNVQAVAQIVSGLTAAQYGQDQLYGQLERYLLRQANTDGTLYDDQNPQEPFGGRDVARQLAEVLQDCQARALSLAVALDTANALASRLGNRS